MNIIICVDNKNGYAFAGRRQSRDICQIDRMMQVVGQAKLLLNEYSYKLFQNPPHNVVLDEDFLNSASNGDYCFVENIDFSDIVDRIDKVIIYRWNRDYPSDKKIPQNLLENKKLISVYDFCGNSHEKITQEVYE